MHAALMRETPSETLPVRIATGEIRAYLPGSSDEGMAAGSGTSLATVTVTNVERTTGVEILETFPGFSTFTEFLFNYRENLRRRNN